MTKLSIKEPLVSVIMPFYNAASTLDEAILSIIKQTYVHWELILVNNLSTDTGAAIAAQYVKVNSNIKMVTESKKGVAHAFNKGLTLAKGQYISRIDADDEMFPERLKKQIEFLEKNQTYGLVGGLAVYGKKRYAAAGMEDFVKWNNAILTYPQIQLNQFVESPIINPTVTFRKSTLDLFGSYEAGNFPEDYELWLRLLKNGVKMAKISEPVIHWNDSETRLTRQHSSYASDAFYQIKTLYLADWLKQHNPFYPKIWIWGAGRVSRKRAEMLKSYGVEIAGYIDVDVSKYTMAKIIHFSELPTDKKLFIVSYVANRGARHNIKNYLNALSYTEGIHFICAA